MAWDGNGNYVRTNGVNSGATVWADDKAASVKITTARHDPHDQDLATGINACLTKDGENSATLINVDNLRLDGNTLSSTDTNGDINLSPNGTGNVVLAESDLQIGATVVTATGAELNLLDGVIKVANIATGSWATSGISVDDQATTDIAHGLGTNAVVVQMTMEGSSDQELMGAHVNSDGEGAIVAFGRDFLGSAVDLSAIASPASGSVRLICHNLGNDGQSATVRYVITAID